MNPWFSSFDCLAPGDQKSREFEGDGVAVTSIESSDHPLFERAFAALWREFGEKAEIEQRSVIQSRFEWQGRPLSSGARYFYQLLWIEKEGVPLGVRDHTVITHSDHHRVIVHLSHNLLFPVSRRTGLAGWMRAWPLVFAKRCQKEWGIDLPITLVAEMEPIQIDSPERLPRLISVERAGFLKIGEWNYLQPDFRDPAAIDSLGGSVPLEMSLVIRRVGEEGIEMISGEELHGLARGLYRMYGRGFREQEMRGPWEREGAIEGQKGYPLVKPTFSSR